MTSAIVLTGLAYNMHPLKMYHSRTPPILRAGLEHLGYHEIHGTRMRIQALPGY